MAAAISGVVVIIAGLMVLSAAVTTGLIAGDAGLPQKHPVLWLDFKPSKRWLFLDFAGDETANQDAGRRFSKFLNRTEFNDDRVISTLARLYRISRVLMIGCIVLFAILLFGFNASPSFEWMFGGHK